MQINVLFEFLFGCFVLFLLYEKYFMIKIDIILD